MKVSRFLSFSRMSVKNTKCTVIIIGAGLAGLSAASHLVKNGVKDLVILEASDRIGGRILSVPVDSGNIDLGAQWIHGGCAANSLYNYAIRHKLISRDVVRLHESADEDNLLSHWPTTVGYIYRPDGKPISENASRKAYEIFNSIFDEAEQYKDRHCVAGHNQLSSNTRLSTFYNGRKRKALEAMRKSVDVGLYSLSFLKDVDLALTGLGRILCIETGDDISKVSLELLGLRHRLPGGHVILPSGAGTLIESLKKDICETTIKLGHEVSYVDWTIRSREQQIPEKIIVQCRVKSTGECQSYHADYVIVTLPLGVLKKCHQKMFSPQLSLHKVKAIENIGYGQLSKIFLQWRNPWWARGEGGIQLAWPSDVTTLVRPNPKDLPSDSKHKRSWYRGICNFSEVDFHPNLLVCWIAGDSAATVDDLEDDEVILTIMDVLRQFTGDPALPGPDKMIRHCWNTDPYSLGSGSYPSLSTTCDDFEKFLEPLPSFQTPKLLFAGEHTHPQYWGQMLGARLSGLREAERVLNRMEDVEHLAKELRSIALESSSAHKTMQTKARFLNSLSPISPIASTPVPPNQYTGSHCATPIPQLELTRQERSFVQQDRKSSLGSLNHQKPQTLLIPYSRSSTTFHYSQKIQQPRPILVKAKITDLPE